MTFYQAMQVGANVMKPLIKDTQSKKLKQKYFLPKQQTTKKKSPNKKTSTKKPKTNK